MLFVNNKVINNHNGHGEGGGLYLKDCDATIIGSLFADNHSGKGAGIHVVNSDLTLINTSIMANHASSSVGAGGVNGGNVTLINTIIEGNTTTGPGTNAGFNEVERRNSFIGEGGPFNQDHSLKSNSKSIDSGTVDTTGLGLPLLDIAGKPRISGGRVDIGAYEWRDPSDPIDSCKYYNIGCSNPVGGNGGSPVLVGQNPSWSWYRTSQGVVFTGWYSSDVLDPQAVAAVYHVSGKKVANVSSSAEVKKAGVSGVQQITWTWKPAGTEQSGVYVFQVQTSKGTYAKSIVW